MALTVTITDPATIELLYRYRHYVEQVDDVRASVEQLTEGLVIGLLDGHDRFNSWRRSIDGRTT